jgi:hypothetical protein
MARAWIQPATSGWGDVQKAKAALGKLGYLVDELRGSVVLLRVSAAVLEPGELLTMPGEALR